MGRSSNLALLNSLTCQEHTTMFNSKQSLFHVEKKLFFEDQHMRCITTLLGFGLAINLLLLCMAGAIAQPSAGPAAKELDPKVVEAWKKAGARVGWMAEDRSDRFFRGDAYFREGSEGKSGEVPAFRFSTWTAGVVDKLPQPQTAFGQLSISSLLFVS